MFDHDLVSFIIFKALKSIDANSKIESKSDIWKRDSNDEVVNPTNLDEITLNRLRVLWNNHETALFDELLELHGLSQSWKDVILPLAHRVSEIVNPDVRHANDMMDIRQ